MWIVFKIQKICVWRDTVRSHLPKARWEYAENFKIERGTGKKFREELCDMKQYDLLEGDPKAVREKKDD